MKVTLIGSHLCPDTLYAINRLCEAGAELEFKNLSASLADLKAYLALRESSPLFDGPKARGSLGIPCFVLEDGTLTLDLEQVLAALNEATEPGKPKAILAHTVKGKGVSFMENQAGWHGKAPNEEERQQALKELEG